MIDPGRVWVGVEASVAAVGPYQLQGLLGRGGMGEVYRAFDTRRERVVALKLLAPGLAQDPTYRERFRRESLTAAGLSSPHVIPIHDFGEVAGRLFIDMRLVNGRDLTSHLQHGPFTPARAVAVIGQVGDALADAHRHGVIHRDVKPSNVLLTDTDFAYLVDFGIAHATGEASLTETGTTVGTFGYMSPERLAGGPTDPRADVYSLACVLCELLVGQRPFAQHASTPALIQAHLHEPAPAPSRLNPQVSPGFDPVVARGMAKDPAQRYPTITAFLEDLQRQTGTRAQPPTTRPATALGEVISFAADHPVASHNPTGPASPPGPWLGGRPRRRVLLTALAGVGLVALGALITLGLRSGSAATSSAGVSSVTASTAPAGATGPSASGAGGGSGGVSRYTLRLTGTAKAANVTLEVDGSSGSVNQASLPWSRDVDANPGSEFHLAQLSAFTPAGDPGNLTCTILDQDGHLLGTQTATSQGGQFGSASVHCASS